MIQLLNPNPLKILKTIWRITCSIPVSSDGGCDLQVVTPHALPPPPGWSPRTPIAVLGATEMPGSGCRSQRDGDTDVTRDSDAQEPAYDDDFGDFTGSNEQQSTSYGRAVQITGIPPANGWSDW